jgi:uncharacterized protein (TIGR02452 family)
MDPLATDASRKRKSDEAFAKKARNRAVIMDTLQQCESVEGLGHVKRSHVCTLLGTQERIQSAVLMLTPKVQVRNADCAQVAAELCKIPGAKVWLLNMASASKPGGGVMSGCNAQEEHLCRCSNLLPQLRRAAAEGKYPLHLYDHSDTPGFSVLVHSQVIFFRDPQDYSILPTDDWSQVGVLTAAAERVGPGQTAGPNAPRFIDYLLDVAQMQECSHLVISAWGCGAFGQSAAEVARCFRLALERVSMTTLPEVVFAVVDDHNSKPPGNLHIFKTELEQCGLSAEYMEALGMAVAGEP